MGCVQCLFFFPQLPFLLLGLGRLIVLGIFYNTELDCNTGVRISGCEEFVEQNDATIFMVAFSMLGASTSVVAGVMGIVHSSVNHELSKVLASTVYLIQIGFDGVAAGFAAQQFLLDYGAGQGDRLEEDFYSVYLGYLAILQFVAGLGILAASSCLPTKTAMTVHAKGGGASCALSALVVINFVLNLVRLGLAGRDFSDFFECSEELGVLCEDILGGLNAAAADHYSFTILSASTNIMACFATTHFIRRWGPSPKLIAQGANLIAMALSLSTLGFAIKQNVIEIDGVSGNGLDDDSSTAILSYLTALQFIVGLIILLMLFTAGPRVGAAQGKPSTCFRIILFILGNGVLITAVATAGVAGELTNELLDCLASNQAGCLESLAEEINLASVELLSFALVSAPTSVAVSQLVWVHMSKASSATKWIAFAFNFVCAGLALVSAGFAAKSFELDDTVEVGEKGGGLAVGALAHAIFHVLLVFAIGCSGAADSGLNESA